LQQFLCIFLFKRLLWLLVLWAWEAGNQVTLVGGVNTTDFIHAAPGQIAAQVRRCIAEGQVDGSRYILSSGCALPRDAKRENLLSLRRAAETSQMAWSCQAGQ
jgi:uroporphyrinogen-III decarboxylase